MDTREKILKAAVEVFGHTPNSSIAAVSKKADITRMTISRYFKSKDVLIFETGQYCINLFQDAIDKAVQSNDSSIDKLKQILTNYIPLYSHYLFLIRAFNANTEDKESEQLRNQILTVNKITEKAKEDGFIREDFPTTWISIFLDFIAVGIGTIKESGTIVPNDVERLAIESFLYGCSVKRSTK